MKKIIPLSLILFGILYEPVYAISKDVKLYTNIVAFGLVFIGVIIILVSKISGLTDKDKIKEIKDFNPDSIFKVLPTFSSKKFEEETKRDLNNELKNNDDSFKITDFKITDFKEDNDKYTIKSWASIETGYKKNKETNFYTITSINNRTINKDLRCPVCGGKVKDPTKLRCMHCGSILPNNNTINNDEWKTESIEKTT